MSDDIIIYVCALCKEWIDKDDLSFINGKWYCIKCLAKEGKYFTTISGKVYLTLRGMKEICMPYIKSWMFLPNEIEIEDVYSIKCRVYDIEGGFYECTASSEKKDKYYQTIAENQALKGCLSGIWYKYTDKIIKRSKGEIDNDRI